MLIERHNAWTYASAAPAWFGGCAAQHLAIRVDDPTGKRPAHLERLWAHEGALYGSLLWPTGRESFRVPGGLTPWLVALADHYRVPYVLADRRRRPDEAIPYHALGQLQWRPYQDAVHRAVIDHGTGVIVASPRCLAGGMRVGVNRGGGSVTLALRDLVHRFNGGVIKGRRGPTMAWDPAIPTRVRVVDASNNVRLGELRGAFSNGVRDVWRLTTRSGHALEATREHKVLTPGGWRLLGECEIGQDIYVERSTAERRVTPATVTACEHVGEGETFDLEVDAPHCFLANGVAVHNSGKTRMAARAIDTLGLPAIYIAPSKAIVAQTYEVFCELFGDQMIGRLDSDATWQERGLERPIVVATAASAVQQDPEWWAQREVLIVDEYHRSAAPTYHKINDLAAHIYYRLGFTGTHFRTGGDDLAMQAIASTVLSDIALPGLIEGGYLAAPKIVFERYIAPAVKGTGGNWATLYRAGIAQCAARNARVIARVEQLQEEGTPTIVLTRRRQHADWLGDKIADSVVVKGGESALTSRAVRDFLDGRHSVLIGTTVIGEGVDVPRASALVYASGGRGGVQFVQSYFRPLTGYPGKAHGQIYDFFDMHNSTLRQQSTDRVFFARKHFGAHSVSIE